jgi:hypothetical protein
VRLGSIHQRFFIRVNAGESYRSAANDVVHLSRASLSRVYKDDQRREGYLDATAEDERIDEALNRVRADELH